MRSAANNSKTQALAFWLLLMSLISSCGPALETLLAERHYREAICAASERYDDSTEALVSSAIEKDLQPAFHIHPVSLSELQQLLGPDADMINSKIVILRLRYDSNTVPIDRFELRVSFGPEKQEIETIPIVRSSLAEITGESLPKPHQKRITGRRRKARHTNILTLTTIPLALIWDIGTLGATGATKASYNWLFPKSPDRHVTHYPSDEEYAGQAPTAETLYQALASEDCSSKPGSVCDRYILLERPDTFETIELLSIHLKFEADRTSGYDLDFSDKCIIWPEPLEITLTGEGDLEHRIHEAFGQRMRLLDEFLP